jgi:hypothetical protein
LCSFELHIFGGVSFVGVAQVPQPAMKVVEDDGSPIDLHLGFDEHYHGHEFFCHVSEVTSLQPYALDQSRHSSNVHALLGDVAKFTLYFTKI